MYPQQSFCVPMPYDIFYPNREMVPGTGHSAVNSNPYVQMDGHHNHAMEGPLLSEQHIGPQNNITGQQYPNDNFNQMTPPHSMAHVLPSPCVPADLSHTWPAASTDMPFVGYPVGPAMNGQMPAKRSDMLTISQHSQNAIGSPSIPMPNPHDNNMVSESRLNSIPESMGHPNHDEPDACTQREMERLGKGVKRRRHSMGLTQKNVGDCIGSCQNAISISQTTICRFEAGVLSSSNMLKLHPVINGWLDKMEKLNPDEVTTHVQENENLPKRKRTNIDQVTRQYLEGVYIHQNRPNMQKIQIISEDLNLEPKIIRVWFSNRRQKHKTDSEAAESASTLSHVTPPTVSPEDFTGSWAPTSQPVVNYPASNMTPYMNFFQ